MRSWLTTLRTKAGEIRRTLRARLYAGPRTRQGLIDDFTRLYFDSWQLLGQDTVQVRWLGQPMLKCPLDLWTYQEIVHETRPELIVELGTLHGGSALYFASLLELCGIDGQVLSVDIKPREGRPRHPRITYIEGSSTAPKVVAKVRERAAGRAKVLVCLDSDHGRDHVLEELRQYADLVGVGQYLIVEDTIVHGNPVHPDHGPGPAEALRIFLAEDQRFEVDRARERFFLTFNRGGYLRRVR